jgi:hypothetical protein
VQLTADQQPFQQGYLPILSLCEQIVYGLAPINVDTGAGFVTPRTTRPSRTWRPRVCADRLDGGTAGRQCKKRARASGARSGRSDMGERLIELRNIAKSYGRVYRRRRRQSARRSRRSRRPARRQRRGQIDADQDARRRHPADERRNSGARQGLKRIGTPRARATPASRPSSRTARWPSSSRSSQHLHGPRDHDAGSAFSMSPRTAEAERLMREIGFTSKVFSPDSIVGQLSGGERQGVALARAIYNKADLIVMDEPTTALSLTETEKVFRFVRTVRSRRAIHPLHRPQHPSCLRYRRSFRRDGSRAGCARGR